MLNGKHIAITGGLKKMGRRYAAELVRRKGGFVSNTVNGRTDFLVVTNTAKKSNAKYITAKANGVPMITEREFMAMLG